MGTPKPTRKAARSPRRLQLASLALLAILGIAAAAILFNRNGSRHSSAEQTATSDGAASILAETGPGTSPSAKSTNGTPPTAADLENQAVALMAEGKVDEALAYLNRAVKLNPDDETTHFNLA